MKAFFSHFPRPRACRLSTIHWLFPASVAAVTVLAVIASAGTYTWTGAAGDGLWFTAGNWNYEGNPAASSPGNAPSDDVVIANGDTVTYAPGGDWMPTGTTTISGGSTLVQVSGGAWPNIQGALILDGGHYDSGSAGQIRVNATITVRNGGSATLQNTVNTSGAGIIVVEAGGTVVRTGAWNGNNTPPLVMRGGWFECQGTISNPNANDEYTSGTIFVSSGEFQPPADTQFDLGGVDWIVRMISPRANGVPVLSGGSLTLFHTGNDGFYQMSGVHADIPAGSGATVTVPRGPDEVYTRYFSNGKFTVAGATLTAAEFAEQIIVESAANPTNGTGTAYSTFRLAAVSPYGITAPAVANVGQTSGTISALVSKTAEGANVYALWGTSEASTDNLSAWGHVDNLGTAAADITYSEPLTGLAEDVTIYYAFAIVTNGAVAASTAVKSFTPSSYTAVFTGAAGDGLWATASNWRSGVVPTESDTILIAADCTRSGNLNLQNWDITVNGASFTASGEITPASRTIRDGALSATVYVAGGPGNEIVVRGSRIVSTTTGRWNVVHRGFYGTDPHFNFRSGDASSYTYTWDPEGEAPVFADEFAAVFVAGKILVDGVALTAADADRVSFSVDTEAHTATLTLLETSVEASFEGASTAAVNGLSAMLSAEVEVGGGRPLYVLTGTDPANLTATLVAAEAADGTTYTYVATGVEGTAVYWQFRLGEAEGGLLDTTVPQSFFAMESGNLWTGALSGLASVPGNWSKGHVPTSTEPVYVVAEFAHNDLEWDIANATVGSWKQLGNAVVYLNGTTSNVLTIAGDAELTGGYWTHAGPADEPSTILNVAVGGDLTVAAGAAIQAGTGTPNDAAQRPRGYTRAHGPGYLREAGGSFAGEGAHIPAADFSGVSTYGSILDPLSHGSGGWGDNANYAGGGVIKLAVDGSLTVNGAICSRGFGYAQAGESNIGGAGSGGSVNITAGALTGSGSIDANGGNNSLYGPGSGGRVKVALTGQGAVFADFDGTIEALGGSLQNNDQAITYDLTPAAAGTVCLSTAADEAPTVCVRNVWRYGNNDAGWRVATNSVAVPSGTHLPPMQDGDSADALRMTNWQLLEHGAIRLTSDSAIASLALTVTNGAQCVYTDGHMLKVNALTVAGVSYKGTQTAATLPAIVIGSGSIVVGNPATVVLLR